MPIYNREVGLARMSKSRAGELECEFLGFKKRHLDSWSEERGARVWIYGFDEEGGDMEPEPLV